MSWEIELLKYLFLVGLTVLMFLAIWVGCNSIFKDSKKVILDNPLTYKKSGIVYLILLLSSFNCGLMFFLILGFIPPHYINEYGNFFGNFELNLSFIVALSAIVFYFSFFYGSEVSKQNKLVSLHEGLGFPEWNKGNRREWKIAFIGNIVAIIAIVIATVSVALLFQITEITEPIEGLSLVTSLLLGFILSAIIFITGYFRKEPEDSSRKLVEEEIRESQLQEGEKSSLSLRILFDFVVPFFFFFGTLTMLVVLGVSSLVTMEEYQNAITILVTIPSFLLLLVFIINNHTKTLIIDELIGWLKWLISDTPDDIKLGTKDVIALLIVFLYLAFGSLWLVFVHPHPSLLLHGTTLVLEIYLLLLLLSLIRIEIPLFTDFIRYLSTIVGNLFNKEAKEGSHPYYWPLLLLVAISLSSLWLHAFYSTL